MNFSCVELRAGLFVSAQVLASLCITLMATCLLTCVVLHAN
jgi:hypothetical protein